MDDTQSSALAPVASRSRCKWHEALADQPLRATLIGAFVRGLSMREIESLCEEAGPGKLSKTTAQRTCSELRERFPPPGRSRPGGYVLWITPERVGGSGPWASHRRQG